MADTLTGHGATSPLGRLYAWCVAAADRASAHPGRTLAIACALTVGVTAAINRFVLLDFPNSGDEYVYLYQAATMAAGRLWNAAPAYPQFFELNYLVHEGGRAYGSFPIGWPLMLSLFARAHVPLGLVNPILGALSLWLVARLGARLYSPRIGVIAAAIVGLSPFFLFNAASYFSHTFCAVLLLGAAVLAARDDRTPAWVPLGIGFLIGWAVLARYLTGVVCAVPIGLWLLRPGVPRPRTVALVALGGLPWVLVLLFYNEAMTGSPWRLTTLPLTVGLWFRDGFVLRSADILSTHLLRHLLWTPPLLVALYVFYLSTAPRAMRRGPLDWMLVLMAAVLYFYVERGGNQYGPRFHYEVFPFVVLFVTANVFREPTFGEKRLRDRRMFAVLAASVALLPVSFAVHASVEHDVIEQRSDPFTMTQAAGLRHALVLIGGRVGTRRSMAAADLTRNGIAHTGSVLYGLDVGPVENCFIRSQYRDRSAYLYVWDHAKAVGVLQPLSCEQGGARP